MEQVFTRGDGISAEMLTKEAAYKNPQYTVDVKYVFFLFVF